MAGENCVIAVGPLVARAGGWFLFKYLLLKSTPPLLNRVLKNGRQILIRYGKYVSEISIRYPPIKYPPTAYASANGGVGKFFSNFPNSLLLKILGFLRKSVCEL